MGGECSHHCASPAREREKVDLLYSCLTFAVNLFLPMRKVKVSSTDKPWILDGLKLLKAKRQKALVIHGKSSQVYKALRNRVQRDCSMCKKSFYNNKVSSLQQCNMLHCMLVERYQRTGRSPTMPLSHRRLMISLADLQAISSLYNICLL